MSPSLPDRKGKKRIGQPSAYSLMDDAVVAERLARPEPTGSGRFNQYPWRAQETGETAPDMLEADNGV